MSVLRQDPTTQEWVIFATERAKRPDELRRKRDREELPSYKESCPFCPSNESQTPPEVLAYRDSGEANGPGWRLRVTSAQEGRGDGMTVGQANRRDG